MDIDALIGDKRNEILKLAEQHGACNVRVFGSVARGEATPDSDVDLRVETHIRPGTGTDFMDLWEELEQLLERKVDLVSEKALDARIRDAVLREAVPFI